MSGIGEQVPLHCIKENEELNLENKDGRKIDGRPKKNSSVRSGDAPVIPLIRAVRRGSFSTSSFLQRTDLNELDITETDNFKRNVFHYAVSKPDLLKNILKQLKTKTSVQQALNQADNDGETPIHRAATIANIESLEILYEYDNSLMELKTTTGKRSVLHLAVRSRSAIAVKFIMDKDPDLANSVDNMLQTPVHYAASLKQTSILEILVYKGCDTTETDTNGQLPIHIATRKGLRNTVELLLREDPDVVDAVDNHGQSPILVAAKNGFPNVVSYLLAKNAHYGLKDKSGLTAFDWAVKRTFPDVVQVFLEIDEWKEVVSISCNGPEGCLAMMIKVMPNMAKMLLDKCVTTKGTKDHPASYQVIYDFFCLESKDKKGGCSRFEALELMAETICGICLRHPVAVKYVDVKWRKRGFKYTMALILLTLLFHICLMVYTTRVIGVVNEQQTGVRNITIHVREGRPPNSSEMMALKVIMLVIVTGAILKEIVQMMMQPFYYFTTTCHYYTLALFISVMLYLLPVNQELTAQQIGYGAVTVMLSWTNLMQFLKVVPVIGIYIILVEKIFWTLMKIFVVVVIYLLSFASTFYVLLAEHESFRNLSISFVSTFVAMLDGIDYDGLFVTAGAYRTIYEFKMVVLVLFMLTMSIVVNNALIGLAVGDANEVMKSARCDKFLRKAKYIIQLERGLSNIPYLKREEDECLIEFPLRRKNIFHKISDLFYFGSEMDVVDGADEESEQEYEMEIALEDNIQNAVELKLENLRSNLQHELIGIRDQIKEDLEEKLGKILENLE